MGLLRSMFWDFAGGKYPQCGFSKNTVLL